jgi:hypothetical protein
MESTPASSSASGVQFDRLVEGIVSTDDRRKRTPASVSCRGGLPLFRRAAWRVTVSIDSVGERDEDVARFPYGMLLGVVFFALPFLAIVGMAALQVGHLRDWKRYPRWTRRRWVCGSVGRTRSHRVVRCAGRCSRARGLESHWCLP